MLQRISWRTALAWVGLVAGTSVAAPVFGPEAFVLTAGDTELFERSFESAEAGGFVLFVRRDEGVASVAIDLNGSGIVAAGDADQASRRLVRPVELEAGTNELVLQLEGEPGSFVTVMVASPGTSPVFTAGRLVLPWGRSDDEHSLALALKNGSRQAPRDYRVILLDPAGQIVAKSEKRHLPPRGSIAFPVMDVMDSPGWTAGSVEVIYTGPGPGRLFGTARQGALTPVPQVDTQPLVEAGHGPVDDGPSTGGDRVRRRAP